MAKTKFEISKHFLVPKHTKLSDKEAEKLLKALNATKDNLPKILVKDPAIAELKAEVGDIIKVVRQSPTAGETEFYRCVTDGQ